jgi:hypothetical protein
VARVGLMRQTELGESAMAPQRPFENLGCAAAPDSGSSRAALRQDGERAVSCAVRSATTARCSQIPRLSRVAFDGCSPQQQLEVAAEAHMPVDRPSVCPPVASILPPARSQDRHARYLPVCVHAFVEMRA